METKGIGGFLPRPAVAKLLFANNQGPPKELESDGLDLFHVAVSLSAVMLQSKYIYIWSLISILITYIDLTQSN